MAGLFETAGAQSKNQSRGKPIYAVPRFETGLFTNRNPLHDPAQFVVSKFYGGYTDTLIDGSNMEISNQLTLIRRPGLSQWSNQDVPDAPNWFYDWRKLNQAISVVTDTPVATYIQTATSLTQIFTKSAGAGQGYYQGVADTLYYGDGVDLQQLAPTGVWNWGIVSPAFAPVVVITPSGSATIAWNAATVFSTMGLIVDQNGNVQQLISINADGTNPSSRIGLSGSGEPAWNFTPGSTTTDGSITWTNFGPMRLWQLNKLYQDFSIGGTLVDPAFIYDPVTGSIQGNTNPGFASGTSGPTKPSFSGVNSIPGPITYDPPSGNHPPGVKWDGIIPSPNVASGVISKWHPSTAYGVWFASAVDQAVVVPYILPPPTNQDVFIFTSSGGTSGTGSTFPAFSTVKGTQTSDNQLAWVCLGTATRAISTIYSAWSSSQTVFSVIKDSNNNLQVCTTTGVSSSIATSSITWATSYGSTTIDGTVIWTCVGNSMAWTTNTKWYLPVVGFAPPSASQPYGGASVIDTNSDVEFAVNSGLSGAVQPTWNGIGFNTGEGTALVLTQVGVVTTTTTYTGTITGGAANALAGKTFLIEGFVNAVNNGIISVTASTATTLVCTTTAQVNETHAGTAKTNLIWYNLAAFAAQSFTWQKGIKYAVSFSARTADDQYNTIAPPGLGAALGPPTGSATGGVSTASPVFTITGGDAGAVNTLSGLGSTDPQVDTIIIWRTLDGGSTLFFLTEIPNPAAIGGIAQPWSYRDFQPDTVINEFIQAPINHQNDPPPAGFLPMAYHFERIWGAVGNFVFSSGGPDVLTGNPNESFDPLNFFEFPSPVTRVVPTATGILVFLTSDIYGILGGPIFNTFFPTPLVPGVGLLHYNALDVHGAVIYMFTADNQFISLDPSGGAQRMGGPIADKLELFDATKVYVTVHESGNDNCIIVSDGSTGWYRLNPSQFPNGNQVWSPFATIVGGAQAVLSIEVTKGIHRLLVGGISANKRVLQRDFTTRQDNGTSYTCYGTVGSLIVAHPGQIAGLTFANIRATRVGTAPTAAFLLNEVSGAFTTFPSAQAYPWQVFGATKQPSSIFSNAYYFRSAGVPALAEHLQLKVSFPAENIANEVLTMSLFGTVEQSPED